MKILLDTCAFLWIASDAPELTPTARHLFLAAEEVWLSAASCQEIVVKNQLGKLPLPEIPSRYIPRIRDAHGIAALPIDETDALHLSTLPPIHRDPFDRLLVSQSICRGLVILTPDPLIHAYPVRWEW
ncbi:MAG: type II toxin-antitoxin system VapC family toxin [Spirochaetaceae bacterium]|nr:MAG: type II toxin-antitoxin system VapC family toxin [Spirochaetaceae bacterium]